VDLLGTNGWDDGIRLYTQPLDWDGAHNLLKPNSGATGNSAFAFFRIPQDSGNISSLELSIPAGYATGSGDALEFAFGIPIPEPGAAGLFLPVVLYAFTARRRSTGFPPLNQHQPILP
jgi:hypothetical protein